MPNAFRTQRSNSRLRPINALAALCSSASELRCSICSLYLSLLVFQPTLIEAIFFEGLSKQTESTESLLLQMVFERIARTLRLGKWKYLAGYDLQGNRYFELPHPIVPGATQRSIDYRIKREWSDYGYDTLPIQWSAWLRQTREKPPTIQELEQDVRRQQRLRENVAELDEAYREEKAALQAEAERLQIREPQKPKAPYPSQSNPSVVPASMAAHHPPSQEFGANIPKSVPQEGVFPGIAQDSPERQQMATSLDQAADATLGKAEKDRQLRSGSVETTSDNRSSPSKRYADTPATPKDSYEPEAWKPVSRRR